MPPPEALARAAGRGAAIVEPTGAHVYVVESARSGGLSIGIDLTPDGACPLACDYCQVPRDHRFSRVAPIDLGLLSRELSAARRRHPHAVDVVFAGSGEPTWSPSFVDALEVARWVAHAPPIPVRVLTSGATLDRRAVHQGLAQLVNDRAGEVWIKLDAWDDRTMARIWGIHDHARHEARIVRFARSTPVVLQSLVAERLDGPTARETAVGLTAAVGRLRTNGARIERLLLGTLKRPPGRATMIAPYDAATLSMIADAVRRTGVRVEVPWRRRRDY